MTFFFKRKLKKEKKKAGCFKINQLLKEVGNLQRRRERRTVRKKIEKSFAS
jgi:hypothetical protein